MEIARRKSAPLEQNIRLSQSILWKLQRNYFQRQGIAAWRTGAVPHHITSSSFIADAYARVVFGYFRDCHAVVPEDSGPVFTPLDPSQPVYIVELGSGPGRFGYLFLKKFLNLYRNSALPQQSFKYVMTDFIEQNLDYWRAHRWLEPLIAEGVLDCARFDIERDEELTLLQSGEVLSSRTLRNPLIVISNYLFDSVPQDAFSIADGQLFEKLMTVTTARKETDPDDPEILSRAEVTFQNHQINGNYYEDSEWNRLLSEYKDRLPTTSFLFPTAALQCVRKLQGLSNGRMLLLSGDRGYRSDEELLLGEGEPRLTIHGSFSMMVDYQIIGDYCRNQGAQALHPEHRHDNLNISAFLFGDSPQGFAETRQAYAEGIGKFGPDDFFTLKSGIEQVYDVLGLDHLLAFLRLSGWDYKRFWECLPTLKNRLSEISEIQKRELYEAIQNVWDMYLPIGEENDLAFQLGTLLLELGFHVEAVRFLEYSIELYEVEPGTAYNLGVCYYSLQQPKAALEWVERALELAPDFAEARILREELASAVPVSRKVRRKRRA